MNSRALLIIIFLIVRLTKAHIVEIENGKISGVEYDDYFAYRGIKYAQAERFSHAKPNLEKWNDVKELKNRTPDCAQYDHLTYEFSGEEDCLFLNVFVPKKVLKSDESVPVINYIHGGAFMFGGSDFYLPDHIMRNGKMILVTINYRLGILGFLSTEDEVLPGNLGMKDQVEALKWVQRNIKNFNGDSSKVTIVGYSAGGASVHMHYLSPLSNGLFNNGISHSGVALNPWVMMENAKDKAHKVAEYLNCPFDDHEKMIKCLKTKPVSELVSLAKHFQPFMYNPFSPFGIVVEPPHKSAFLTEKPQILLQNGKFHHKSWLLSFTKDEGNYPAAEFYSDEKILQNIDDNWNKFAPHILDFDSMTRDSDKKIEVARIIRKFYMHKMSISRENYQAFVDIISDRLYKFNGYQAMQLQSKHSPSYFYYFKYKSLSSVGEYMSHTNDNLGISHGEDVFLIFNHTIRSIPYSDDELKMGQKLIDLYYEYASNDLPIFSGMKIEPSKPDSVKYLDISSNDEFKMIEIDESFGNVKFWEKMEKSLENSERLADEL